MNNILVISVIVFLSAACSSTPVSSSQAKPVPATRLLAFDAPHENINSKIIVTRDAGYAGSACFAAFSINGKLAARYGVAETATFYVQPGEAVLGYTFNDPEGSTLCNLGAEDRWIQRETVLRPGETKYFRLTLEVDSGSLDIIRSNN